MNDYPAATVQRLKEACEEQINIGNADKKIMISCDDEGNGFHGLFYLFMYDPKMIDTYKDLFHDDVDPEKVILLG